MKALCPAAAVFGSEPFVGYLSRSLASAVFHRESRHLADAVPRGAKSFRRFIQPKPKRAYDTCGDDCDARRSLTSLRRT